jgi:hypothetical protein
VWLHKWLRQLSTLNISNLASILITVIRQSTKFSFQDWPPTYFVFFRLHCHHPAAASDYRMAPFRYKFNGFPDIPGSVVQPSKAFFTCRKTLSTLGLFRNQKTYLKHQCGSRVRKTRDSWFHKTQSVVQPREKPLDTGATTCEVEHCTSRADNGENPVCAANFYIKICPPRRNRG